MAINKTTKYTIDPNTIPVTTSTGTDQQLDLALDERITIEKAPAVLTGSIIYGTTSSDDTQQDFQDTLDFAKTNNRSVELSSNLYIGSTVTVPDGVYLDCRGYYINALSGFAPESTVLKFGDEGTDSRWSGQVGKINIEANGQRLVCLDFSRPWHYVPVESLILKGSTYKGLLVSSGGGLDIQSLTVPMASLVSGYSTNADADSIAVHFDATDHAVGRITAFGAATGLLDTGGNNEFHNAHVWSTYDSGKHRAMVFGFRMEGQGSNIVGGFVDGISLVDINQPASSSNGGYAYYVPFAGDGFMVGLHNCKNFIPDRTVFGETLPNDKIVSLYAGKRLSLVNLETIDRVGTVLSDYVLGEQSSSITYVDQRKIQLYSSEQVDFRRSMYARRGLEFNANYFDSPEQDGSFGATRMYQTADKWLNIRTNDEGSIRNIKLEMRKTGDVSVKTSLEGTLGSGDVGYQFYQTDTNPPRLLVWDGSAFRRTTDNTVV